MKRFISLVDESQTDIVKRINISITTLSHELLDIYHSTRNKQNEKIYLSLPESYLTIIDKLHVIYKNMKKNNNLNNGLSNKISVTIDDVYTLIKKIDIYLLINIYGNREILRNYKLNNFIRKCSETLLEEKLLK
jgi:hypothetical protein